MDPAIVLAMGMRAFDALTGKTGTAMLTREGDGARLCAMGEIAGTKVVGIIHPTGSQVSNEDWKEIMPKVQALMV